MKLKLIISCVALSMLFSTVAFASDPYSGIQWYLSDINADKAWALTKGSGTVIVAVVDTGVDLQQPDLTGNIWVNPREIPGDAIDNDGNGFIDDSHGWNFIKNTGDVTPDIAHSYNVDAVSHGTFVAGLIAAAHDNDFGIKGVTANVKIMPIVALDAQGNGNSANVSKAIDYAVANGAVIINLSFGGYEQSSALKSSIDKAYNRGVLVVAASGNAEKNSTTGRDLTKNPVYPVCYDRNSSVNEVLGVIATDAKHKVASFTNYGAGCIDIAAPGIDIISLLYHTSTDSHFFNYIADHWSGSSFATALVSGSAALLKSYNPSLTAKQMIDLITKNSGILFVDQDKYKGQVGEGFLDVYRALQAVTPSPAVVGSKPSSLMQPVSSNAQFFVAPKSGKTAVIKVFNSKFEELQEIAVVDGSSFKGINFHVDSIDAEAHKVIVAAGGAGAEPLVRILSLSGEMLHSFYAYDAKFKGGVNAAVGDINGDGTAEVVTVPQSGAAPIVKIFDLNGKFLNQFYAFDKSYTKGLNIRVADMDKDGKAEIAIAPHSGMMPKIKFFNSQGILKKSLTVYKANFLGGVNFDLADINKDGKPDIITGAGATGGPHVKVVDYNGKQLVSFMAYDGKFTGGVEVAAVDWNNDGKVDIVTAPSSKGGPDVKIFSQAGVLLQHFFPWEDSFTGGVNIGAK